MGSDWFNKCFQFVDMKENQLMIRSMQSSSFPNMKKEARSSFFKKINGMCFPSFVNEDQAQETNALKNFIENLENK